MKTKFVAGLVVMVAMAVGSAMAWDFAKLSTEQMNVKGSGLQIDGTAFTGTAAQLNTAASTAGSGVAPASTLTGNVATARLTNAVDVLNIASNVICTIYRAGTVFDATGVAITNAAGQTISPVTNVTVTIQTW